MLLKSYIISPRPANIQLGSNALFLHSLGLN